MTKYGEPWHGVDDTIETVYGRVPEIEARRQELRERAIACVNAFAGLRPSALAELIAAAEDVWDSVPATYDETHPSVVRHAQALRRLRSALEALQEDGAAIREGKP